MTNDQKEIHTRQIELNPIYVKDVYVPEGSAVFTLRNESDAISLADLLMREYEESAEDEFETEVKFNCFILDDEVLNEAWMMYSTDVWIKYSPYE